MKAEFRALRDAAIRNGFPAADFDEAVCRGLAGVARQRRYNGYVTNAAEARLVAATIVEIDVSIGRDCMRAYRLRQASALRACRSA